MKPQFQVEGLAEGESRLPLASLTRLSGTTLRRTRIMPAASMSLKSCGSVLCGPLYPCVKPNGPSRRKLQSLICTCCVIYIPSLPVLYWTEKGGQIADARGYIFARGSERMGGSRF